MKQCADITLDLSSCTSGQYEDIFKTHYKLLCLIAFKITNEWSIAEDIVQDLFVKCWQNKNTIGIIENFRVYAATSIRNAAINYVKSTDAHMAHHKQYSSQNILLSENNNQEDDEAKEERLLKLLNALNLLPARRKEIFIQFFFNHIKYADIAKQENISIETVKTHIKLTYQFLRKMLLSIFL